MIHPDDCSPRLKRTAVLIVDWDGFIIDCKYSFDYPYVIEPRVVIGNHVTRFINEKEPGLAERQIKECIFDYLPIKNIGTEVKADRQIGIRIADIYPRDPQTAYIFVRAIKNISIRGKIAR